MTRNLPPQPHYALMALFGEAGRVANYEGPLPSHFNVLPWLTFDKPHRAESACDLMRTARRLLLLHDAFQLVGETPKQLGKDGKTASVVVSSNIDLGALHRDLANGFSDEFGGVSFVYPEYSGAGYLPHVTPKADVPFAVGDRLRVESVAVVTGDTLGEERTPKNMVRVIGSVGLL